MRLSLKQVARAAIPNWITECVRRLVEKLDPLVNLSYSQDGEDMILRRMLEGKKSGFYVDIGAHHPFRFSNTCHFHRLGWRGINVDADPTAIESFKFARPYDINVCVGISDTPGELLFHFFNEPALNTFDADLAAERMRMPGYCLREARSIQVRRLDDLLTEFLPQDQAIDFLSIDVEGMDLSVLRSGNWIKFRPRLLLVEAREPAFSDIMNNPIHKFADTAGYEMIAKTLNTLIYEDRLARTGSVRASPAYPGFE